MSDNIGKHGILTNEAGVSIPGTVTSQNLTRLFFRIDGASASNYLNPGEWVFTPDVVRQTRAEWIKGLPIGTVFLVQEDTSCVHVKVSDEYTVEVGAFWLANVKITDDNWGRNALEDVGLEVRSELPKG